MIRLVIFDRDGVINELIEESGAKRSPRKVSEVKVNPDIRTLMRKLDVHGIFMAIASNQPEISRGFIDEATLFEINSRILEVLELNIGFHICLHDNADNCFCRKPKPGLLFEILRECDIQIGEAIFIGDRLVDALAAAAAGMKFLQYQGGGPGTFKYLAEGKEETLSGEESVFKWISNQ